jgi:hypothetical protein
MLIKFIKPINIKEYHFLMNGNESEIKDMDGAQVFFSKNHIEFHIVSDVETRFDFFKQCMVGKCFSNYPMKISSIKIIPKKGRTFSFTGFEFFS